MSNIASEVTLIYRRNEFRGALDSVEKVQELKNLGKIRLIMPEEVKGILGNGRLSGVVVEKKGEDVFIADADHFIPLFSLSQKLGPIGNWGLKIREKCD